MLLYTLHVASLLVVDIPISSPSPKSLYFSLSRIIKLLAVKVLFLSIALVFPLCVIVQIHEFRS